MGLNLPLLCCAHPGDCFKNDANGRCVGWSRHECKCFCKNGIFTNYTTTESRIYSAALEHLPLAVPQLLPSLGANMTT